MRFEQTLTILRKLTPDYHRAVSRFYQLRAEGEVSPRVRLMLDYLIDHELNRALALKEFCEETPPHTLDQWIKGLEMRFPEARADLLSAETDQNLDHLICAAIGYKTPLIHYFEHLLDHCTEKKTANIFLTLKNQEEKAMKRMVRHAQGLADL
ncbi:MAG: aminoglycoside phosphotransferase [Deltaproteobacteria bacterium]|nr:aminoglycoside phosphotransferase [Deltaproteobacteria bacterium]NCP02116.1 aminoglycoside phosphotransferase [Deltaproteobacteria bacterium]NCP77716.1 aminoglycoside phosphotransferase [Desulfuromonadales bacterium]